MKQESVLNVLMYLFKNHLYEQHEINTDDDELIEQLEEVGFHRQTIYQALGWLGQLTEPSVATLASTQNNAIRVYTPEECKALPLECRSLINYLERYLILTPYTREMVINQTLSLQAEGIDTHLIKWVTLLVLFAQPDEKNALARMEFFVLDDPVGSLH